MGKLSEMPRFLVASILQTLCGESHQLAQILRKEGGSYQVQITSTKNAPQKAFLDASLLAAFHANLLCKTEALDAVQQLRENGFRISPTVIAWFERELEQS